MLNTEYRLFSDKGPRVSLQALHRCRLDECAKCIGVAPAGATVRLFWADAVISLEGPDFGRWLRVVGRTSPSEQGMSWYLLPNIEAAWRGEWRTRTLAEGEADCAAHGFPKAEFRDPCFRDGRAVEPKQPSPGISVWRSLPRADEDWTPAGKAKEGDWDESNNKWRGYGGDAPWPTGATVESATHFLERYRGTDAVGVLLAYQGAKLDFVATRPLAAPGKALETPEACITVLGGPKGITPTFARAIKDVFSAATVPLLEVCLGPEEEMAHACVAFLRLQDDAGRYRAAVVDLLRLGREGYDRRAARLRQAYESAALGDSENRSRSRSPHKSRRPERESPSGCTMS